MTQPLNEEAQRVRGYIVAQANKLSLPDLVAKVRKDTAPLREVGAAVPAARFNERPAPGEWSAAEIWTHILQMNERGATAIEGILDRAALPERISDVVSGESRGDLANSEAYWAEYIDRRERLLARVLEAQGDEHPQVKITHSMFGPFTWREWLLFMRVHDLDHMRQLQSVTEAFS